MNDLTQTSLVFFPTVATIAPCSISRGFRAVLLADEAEATPETLVGGEGGQRHSSSRHETLALDLNSTQTIAIINQLSTSICKCLIPNHKPHFFSKFTFNFDIDDTRLSTHESAVFYASFYFSRLQCRTSGLRMPTLPPPDRAGQKPHESRIVG